MLSMVQYQHLYQIFLIKDLIQKKLKKLLTKYSVSDILYTTKKEMRTTKMIMKMKTKIGDYFFYHPVIEGIFITVCTIAIVILLSLGGALAMSKVDSNKWNNGICAECETGHYKYSTSVGRYSTHIYTCDNCDHCIEMNFLK